MSFWSRVCVSSSSVVGGSDLELELNLSRRFMLMGMDIDLEKPKLRMLIMRARWLKKENA